ncbi:hypothetical protein [Hydrogenophaga luteola]
MPSLALANRSNIERAASSRMLWASRGRRVSGVMAGWYGLTLVRGPRHLKDGISEAGAIACRTAAATSGNVHGLATPPFYNSQSVFCFQRMRRRSTPRTPQLLTPHWRASDQCTPPGTPAST